MDVLAYIFNVTLCQNAVHVRAAGVNVSSAAYLAAHNGTAVCSSDECLAMRMEQMCSVMCCSKFCCHKVFATDNYVI